MRVTRPSNSAERNGVSLASARVVVRVVPARVPVPVPERGPCPTKRVTAGDCGARPCMTTFDHERLDVYQLALEFIRDAHDTINTIPPGDASLADQLRRAATSICLNIAEGSGEFSRKEKARFYRIAKRSATECAAIMDILRTRGIADSIGPQAREQLEARKEVLRRIVSMLIKLVRRMEAAPE